jgi:hypothetical protein
VQPDLRERIGISPESQENKTPFEVSPGLSSEIISLSLHRTPLVGQQPHDDFFAVLGGE